MCTTVYIWIVMCIPDGLHKQLGGCRLGVHMDGYVYARLIMYSPGWLTSGWLHIHMWWLQAYIMCTPLLLFVHLMVVCTPDGCLCT